MSLLSDLLKKRKDLKPCKTLVTSLAGSKYVEMKNNAGETQITKLAERCSGFIVDYELDLQIAKIMDYLYLSSQDVAQDIDLLQKNGITHVLSIGIDLQTPEASHNIKFKKIELLDEPSENILNIIAPCFEFIEGAKMENKNNKVLIHCNAGYSRSPSIVIAYLIQKYGYSLEESFNIVKQKRNIKPNVGFMEQLKKLEDSLIKA